VTDTLAKIAHRKSGIHGYKFTYAPPLLRHFTAKFQPV
jgi:tryptophanase